MLTRIERLTAVFQEHAQAVELIVQEVDRFWELGRLTLEPWLYPRLDDPRVHRHELAEVTAVAGDGPLRVDVSDGQRLEVDHVVFATGYRPDLARVPYLAGLLSETERKSLRGFPGLLHIPVISALFASNDTQVQQTDIIIPARGASLDMTRTYHSADPTDVGFGPGWSFPYAMSVTQEFDGSRTVRMPRPGLFFLPASA